MIYKTYKITYEKLSKIMDLSIFKNHINIGKSFSFLIKCNVYSNEIDSIELCDEHSTSLFLSGECESVVDVRDYNNVLLGEIYLPGIINIESNSKVIEATIDYSKLNLLLKVHVENNFKKKVVINDAVLKTDAVILKLQAIIKSQIHDEEIFKVRNYEDLIGFFISITKDFKEYVRKPNIPYSTPEVKLDDIKNDNEKKLNNTGFNESQNKSTEKNKDNNIRSTLKRLVFLKEKLTEINLK